MTWNYKWLFNESDKVLMHAYQQKALYDWIICEFWPSNVLLVKCCEQVADALGCLPQTRFGLNSLKSLALADLPSIALKYKHISVKFSLRKVVAFDHE